MPIDYNKYPPNWKSEIVPRILERAGDKCEFCGTKNHSFVWSVKLWIKDVKRYKFKTIWFNTESGAKRMKGIAGKSKQVYVVLTIAHLDHDEENHEVTDERLRALCQYCHLNYDAKEKYRRAISK